MSSAQRIFAVTAMAAVSGTAVVLFALKLHKSTPTPSPAAQFQPRPCILSGEKKAGREKKKKVRFAKDVVEPTGNNEEFRRNRKSVIAAAASASVKVGMPANRMALYNGMMRDRIAHRLGCSY